MDANSRSSVWKGKSRQLFSVDKRDDGPGASSGIVLSLDMVWTSYYAVAYTVPVQLGPTRQNLSLQVDTGSSDLWVVSKSCSTGPCFTTSGRVYDPGDSTPTNKNFAIQYLEGSVSGPIVWDTVQIGGYTITNQALAAATSVENEPLSYDFDGILGLALPLNSIIQSLIPAEAGSVQDGAPVSSNLLTISPSSSAPSQPFFSLSLARPGSSQTPSLLGIGRHPSQVVSNPSLVRYTQVVSESIGTLYWKTYVRAITVYVNGQVHPVGLQSLSGAINPTVVLDSGMPVILTTSQIANGIYGALGISPASDGQYYVPCVTPLNMTITLDNQPELPIHPLDLTNEPSGQSGAQYCIGLIQSADSQLTSDSSVGDMVLGVPFLRNVYTVMAYQKPNADGTFNTSVASGIIPTLGLLGLTNATQALQEFHNVRVLHQPLDQGPTSQSSTTSNNNSKGLSVGVKVLLGLVGIFVLCIVLFALRYFFARRKSRNQANAFSLSLSDEFDDDHKLEDKIQLDQDAGAYKLARYDSRFSHEEETLTNALQTLPFESHARQISQYTADSGRTYVEDPRTTSGEFGFKNHNQDMIRPSTRNLRHCSWEDVSVDVFVGYKADNTPISSEFIPVHPYAAHCHQRTPSELHREPLLAHHRWDDSRGSGDEGGDLAEFGMFPAATMAGIGTAARGSHIDLERGPAHVRLRSDSSGQSVQSMMPLRADDGAGTGSGSHRGGGAGPASGPRSVVHGGPRPRSSLGSGFNRRSIHGPRPPRPRTAPEAERSGIDNNSHLEHQRAESPES